MNESELLPCPFCGERPPSDLIDTLYPTGRYVVDDVNVGKHYVSYRERAEHPNARQCWNVVCRCGAEVGGDGPQEAVNAWNRRA